MNILLVNDDGYKSKGINILFKVLSDCGHVCTMVAPKKDQSGVGSSVRTNGDEMELVQFESDKWHLEGTPILCVEAGLRLDVADYDIVISGINEGDNSSSLIYISGTVNAAKHASLYGIPSLAVSLKRDFEDEKFEENDFFQLSYLVKDILDELVAKWTCYTFYNLCAPKNFYELVFTVPLEDNFNLEVEQKSENKYILKKAELPITSSDLSTDVGALARKHASISIIKSKLEYLDCV